jgi:DNA polymerase-3 subunit delta'
MDKLLLHPATKARLEGFISRPVGAVLLVGPAGSGKAALARALIAELLGTGRQELSGHPYFLHIRKPETKTEIPIDDIRRLVSSLKLRVPGRRSKEVDRAVFIEDAHFLSGEAQNALLKLLEEPPAATVFILSAISEDKILPTVASRTQRITVLTPSLNDSLAFYPDIPSRRLEADWRLSGGAPGLLASLLSEESHSLKSAVETAKRFLAQDQYHRLIILKQLSSKENFGMFLDGLGRILSALQTESIKKGSRNQSKLLEARRLLEKLTLYHESNVSLRLISLMLASELTL